MKFRSSFSKVPKHARFEYAPRYSKAEVENGEEEEDKRIDFRKKVFLFDNDKIISGKLRRSSIAYRKKEAQKSKMRLLMLIAGLVALILFMIEKNL